MSLSGNLSRQWKAVMRILSCTLLLCCTAGPEALNAATVKLTVRKLGDGFGTVSGNGGLCAPSCTTQTFNLQQGSSVAVFEPAGSRPTPIRNWLARTFNY